jgi:hypothetical protein
MEIAVVDGMGDWRWEKYGRNIEDWYCTTACHCHLIWHCPRSGHSTEPRLQYHRRDGCVFVWYSHCVRGSPDFRRRPGIGSFPKCKSKSQRHQDTQHTRHSLYSAVRTARPIPSVSIPSPSSPLITKNSYYCIIPYITAAALSSDVGLKTHPPSHTPSCRPTCLAPDPT